jgi:hypothetical protein
MELQLVVGPDYWIRGDGNADGIVNLSDGVNLLGFLFLGGPAKCQRAMETNLDGRVDMSDAIYILNHLFLSGPPMAHPFPACGAAEETLPCDHFPCPA